MPRDLRRTFIWVARSTASVSDPHLSAKLPDGDDFAARRSSRKEPGRTDAKPPHNVPSRAADWLPQTTRRSESRQIVGLIVFRDLL